MCLEGLIGVDCKKMEEKMRGFGSEGGGVMILGRFVLKLYYYFF